MAGSINKAIIVGRLGQDVKLTYLPSGQPIAEMSIATDESYKDRDGNKVEKTEWHRVKCFGKSAEFCGQYLGKGRLVYVEGRIQTRSWEDQQGQKRYMTEINAQTVQALDKGPANDAPTSERPAPQQRPRPAQRSEEQGDLGPAFPSEASGLDEVPF